MDTENCFPSIQVSARWSRNPLWSCFYKADVGHLPLRDHEPSPARQFIRLSLAILFPAASQTDQGQAALHPLRCITNALQEAGRQAQQVWSLRGAGALAQPPSAPAEWFGIIIRISDPIPNYVYPGYL